MTINVFGSILFFSRKTKNSIVSDFFTPKKTFLAFLLGHSHVNGFDTTLGSVGIQRI